MRGREAYVMGSMRGREVCIARGVCMAGGDMHNGGSMWSMCSQCAGGTHPTGMHSRVM